jgi:hypothetical protein
MFLSTVMILAVPSLVRAGDTLAVEGPGGAGGQEAQSEPPTPGAGSVEVSLEDESKLKVVIQDEKLQLVTRFGKLAIPIGDIEKIEFGHRVSSEVASSVAAHVASLGSKDFKTREAATTALLKLREKGYPELVRAARSKDAEVARRAEQLVQKIKEQVPEERLNPPDYDVVQTSDGSRLIGRIEMPAFRVRTAPFGEQQLRLADVRSLRSLTYEEPETVAVEALADPGTLMTYQGQVGKTFAFQITGRNAGAGPVVGLAGGGAVVMGGSIWGTDVYTLDSTLALAAVHAGLLRPGQTGVVKVKITGPQGAFQGSDRNGVQSMAYGFFNGAFQFESKTAQRPGRGGPAAATKSAIRPQAPTR